MQDEIANHIERLRESTKLLNSAADSAADTVKNVETFLTECSIGLHASVEAYHSGGNVVHLAYQRISGKKRNAFRIVVVTVDDVRAWSECTRNEKLETFSALPALLEVIQRKTDELIACTERTLQTMKGLTCQFQQHGTTES